MKALNKKERNAAILRFTLWFALSVLIVSVPIVLTTNVPKEVTKAKIAEIDSLIKEKQMEKEFFSVEIQKIKNLLSNEKAKENVGLFNADLVNIIDKINSKCQNKKYWRDSMYRNVAEIARYIVEANKKFADANKTQNDAGNKLEEMKEKMKDKMADHKRNLKSVLTDFKNVGNEIDGIRNKNAFKYKDAAKNTKRKLDEANEKLKEIIEDFNQ